MTFLNPSALWWLLGVPAVVALHLLRPKPRAVTISSLALWRGIHKKGRHRVLGLRLHQFLSLFLATAAWTLVAVAAARPQFGRSDGRPGPVVLLIDGRARLGAAAGSDRETRFERVRREAERWVALAAPDREVAIVMGAADHAWPVAAFSPDPRKLKSKLAAMRPTDAGGDLLDARSLADQMARSVKGRVVELTPVAAPSADNSAITALGVAPIPNRPGRAEVFVEVSQFGNAALDATLDILLDGTFVDARRVEAAAGSAWKGRFEVARPSVDAPTPGHRLVARLNVRDAMDADNAAYAVLPGWRTVPVLMVGRDDPFVEKAIRSVPGTRFETVAPDQFVPSMLRAFPVVVFDDWIPVQRSLDTLVSGTLWIGRPPFSSTDAPVNRPAITHLDEGHPLTRLIDGTDWQIASARPAIIPENDPAWRWEQPIRSGETPLLIAGERTDGVRLAALTFHPLDSTLPLKVAFPLLIANSIHWLSGSDRAFEKAATVGELVKLAEGCAITSELDPDAESAAGTWHPLRAGFYRAETGGNPTWMAANSLDPSESAAAAQPEPDRRSAVPDRPAGEDEAPLCLAAAAAILFIEWWLFNRGRIA
jgi:hypothetical protein